MKKGAWKLKDEPLFYRIAESVGVEKTAASAILKSAYAEIKEELPDESEQVAFAMALHVLCFTRLVGFSAHFALQRALEEADTAGQVMCDMIGHHESAATKPKSGEVVQ